MQRAILAVTLGGLLLTVAACDSDAETTEAATTAPAVTPSSAPASLPPDYSANTRQVCGKIDKIIDRDVTAFGAEMGKMIARKEAKATVEADKAEKAAGQRLAAAAAGIRRETAAAEDPELKTAGVTSAGKLAKAATDTRFFDGIKSSTEFDRVIEARMAEWLSPVTGYCS